MKLLRKVLDKTYTDLKNVNKVVFVSALLSPFLLLLSISNNYFYFISIPALILLMISFILVSSYLKKNYHYLKYQEEYLSDGRHVFNRSYIGKEVVNLKNGKRHGSYHNYYENGNVECVINYKNGELNGLYKSYYKNGNLKGVFNYENGIQAGEAFSYREDGSLFRKSNLVNGKYSGDGFEYYENGNTRMIFNGEKYTFFSEDGIKRCEANICIESINDEIFARRRPVFTGKWTNKGIWKNYNKDGSIDYELSNWNHETNQVMKKTNTGSKNMHEYSVVNFNVLEFAHLKILPDFVPNRRDNIEYSWDSGAKGPPGAYTWGVKPIEVKPILRIEDIISINDNRDVKK
jgi:hypothetical protein